ncbi:MAG: hypothetical protein IKJ01_04705, partial [Lachnospiraceae bacterium]|nr:hypothetical protein [Lachnospiraceae bacterium]
IIPFEGIWNKSSKLSEGRYSKFIVYEANKPHPNRENVDGDYIEIMEVELDHEREVPAGTKSETRLSIDEWENLIIEARDPMKPDKPPIKDSRKLKNLSY